jgi:dihydrofolate reductase
MDALLLGRRTYDVFAGFWPAAPEEVPFTAVLNGVPTYARAEDPGPGLGWSAVGVRVPVRRAAVRRR